MLEQYLCGIYNPNAYLRETEKSQIDNLKSTSEFRKIKTKQNQSIKKEILIEINNILSRKAKE